jgi:hypothetical protein
MFANASNKAALPLLHPIVHHVHPCTIGTIYGTYGLYGYGTGHYGYGNCSVHMSNHGCCCIQRVIFHHFR